MTQENEITVRPLADGECQAVADILCHYAAKAILLWRTAEDIRAHRGDFLVAVTGEEVVGCVALRDYGDGLEEIRSLAVREDYLGQGVGRQLVVSATAFARRRRAEMLFALTLRSSFFERCGFVRVRKSAFPEKVWGDCKLCPRRDNCNEEAVCLDLSSHA